MNVKVKQKITVQVPVYVKTMRGVSFADVKMDLIKKGHMSVLVRFKIDKLILLALWKKQSIGPLNNN